jgi:hypothetical protein
MRLRRGERALVNQWAADARHTPATALLSQIEAYVRTGTPQIGLCACGHTHGPSRCTGYRFAYTSGDIPAGATAVQGSIWRVPGLHAFTEPCTCRSYRAEP